MANLAVYLIVYITLVAIFYYRRNRLLTFVVGAFGLAFLLIEFAVAVTLHRYLAAQEAQILSWFMGIFGTDIHIINETTMMVPDSAGWVGMQVGIESSTVIEISVFVGVIVFYPRLHPVQRFLSLIAGVVGTYILNLFRLLLIMSAVMVFDREVFPIAHNLVGRIIYFLGVIALYWYLLTRPTLGIIQRNLVREQEGTST